jgi:hypothetical protein
VNSRENLEEKMNQRERVVAQLGAMGRCAMAGTLIGLMTTQAFATGVPVAAPETTSITNNDSAIAANATVNLPLIATETTTTDASVLPDAPTVPVDAASVKMPAEMKAMMDDAAQQSQAMTAPATTQKHYFNAGWFALGIVGVGAAAIGAGIYGVAGTKDQGLKIGVGTAFFAPGVLAAGFGFYNAFHKKNKQ